MIKHIVAAILIASSLQSIAKGQLATTQSNYSWAWVRTALSSVTTQFVLELEYNDGNANAQGEEFEAALRYVRSAMPELGISRTYQSQNRMIIQISLPSKAAPESPDAIIQQIIDQFKMLINGRPKLEPASLDEQINKLNEQLRELEGRRAAALAIEDAQGNPISLLKEKLSKLRSEQQRLEMELAAKDSRRVALTKAIDEQKMLISKSRTDDAILQELQKLVKLREQDLAATKGRFVGNAMSNAEVATAIQRGETEISEAKIRVAEREAQLGKATKGELVDRLTDELAMVSVDLADLQLQMQRVKSELGEFDTKTLTSDALTKLLDRDPSLRNPEQRLVSPAVREIDAKQESIYREKFALKVKNVTASILQTSDLGRRGRGGGRGPITPGQSETP